MAAREAGKNNEEWNSTGKLGTGKDRPEQD